MCSLTIENIAWTIARNSARRIIARTLAFLVAGVAVCLMLQKPLAASEPSEGSEPSALDLFNDRIEPIFRSPNPSSCVQCHLASVDLKNYILPSSDATFVSLRDQGLIDLDAPGNSKILTLIKMGEKDLDEPAKLIHAKTRNAELDAFAAWVDACCRDERMRSLPATTEFARPDVPDAVIRHARKSRVVDSFVRNVWSQRMRCFPCHTPHEVDPDNPKHQGAIKKREEFGEKYGAEMLERLEIFRETPEETLAYLIESSKSTPDDRLPLLDLKNPVESLLLLKPMSKLPKKQDDGTLGAPGYLPPHISHMGGLKLHRNDQSFKSIVTWIQDYADVVDGKYKEVEDLPADNWNPSKFIVRVKAVPEAWEVGDIVQLFVFPRNEADDGWSDEPIGFTQGTVTPRRMVNGALFLFGTGNESGEGGGRTTESPKLARGRYLVKTYRDAAKRVAAVPTAILTEKEFAGQAEIPKAKWREGFRFAEMVAGKDLVTP